MRRRDSYQRFARSNSNSGSPELPDISAIPNNRSTQASVQLSKGRVIVSKVNAVVDIETETVNIKPRSVITTHNEMTSLATIRDEPQSVVTLHEDTETDAATDTARIRMV